MKSKLHLYKFDDTAIEWIMSFLGNRTQYVQVESQVSEQLLCGECGAPQGSVLAGILHVINSNDFPACHEEGEAVVYVDDDMDHVSDSDPQVLRYKIEKEGKLSVQWLTDNKLFVV